MEKMEREGTWRERAGKMERRLTANNNASPFFI
jgi:hypothetical protein